MEPDGQFKPEMFAMLSVLILLSGTGLLALFVTYVVVRRSAAVAEAAAAADDQRSEVLRKDQSVGQRFIDDVLDGVSYDSARSTHDAGLAEILSSGSPSRQWNYDDLQAAHRKWGADSVARASRGLALSGFLGTITLIFATAMLAYVTYQPEMMEVEEEAPTGTREPFSGATSSQGQADAPDSVPAFDDLPPLGSPTDPSTTKGD